MVLDGNQYRIIVESAPNMLWRAGEDAECNYFNTTWLAYTGRSMEQELGNGWTEGVHPEDYDHCLRTYLEAFRNHEIFEMLYRLKRHDGEWRWIHDRGVPFYEDSGAFAGYIGSCIDVNDQVMGETWKTMAQKDGLTGIFNRQHFEREARSVFDNVMAGKRGLCAVMIDIDGFKGINDLRGHAFGDKILVAFANILKDNIRDSDLLGRYGGDEFILLLPETGYSDASNIISRITGMTTLPFGDDNSPNFQLSFSFGIAEAEEGESYESLIEKADHAMYEEKKMKKREATAKITPQQ